MNEILDSPKNTPKNNPKDSSSTEEELNNQLLTKEGFSKQVERLVISNKGTIGFIDTVISLCEIYNIDISDTSKLITPAIMEKLLEEATEKRMIKQGYRPLKNESLLDFFSPS